MAVNIGSLFDEIFAHFAFNSKDNFVKIARNSYFKITGTVDHDTRDFEDKMKSFTEWFVLNFPVYRVNSKIYKLYHEIHPIDQKLLESLEKVRFSLFEPVYHALSKKMYLYDLLSGKKYSLMDHSHSFSIIEGELFVGRVMYFENQFYILNGVCPIPLEVKQLVKKQTKLVKSRSVDMTEQEFLLALEGMRFRALSYQHIAASSIFKF